MEQAAKSYLENRKVIIKPIPDRFNEQLMKIDKDHVAKFRFPGCGFTFGVPRSSKHGGLYRFLNEAELKFFEEKLGKRAGDLSFYRLGKNPEQIDSYNFWFGFKISLREEQPLILDLSDPIDYLKYRVCLIRPEIAPSYEERLDSMEYKYYISDESYQVKATNSMAEAKMKAYDELSKIKDNQVKLLDVLRALGKVYSKDSEVSILRAGIVEIIETQNSTGVNNVGINDFLKIIEDKSITVKSLANTALAKNIILKIKSSYYYPTKDDKIATSMDTLIGWLNDIENSEIKDFIALKCNE